MHVADQRSRVSIGLQRVASEYFAPAIRGYRAPALFFRVYRSRRSRYGEPLQSYLNGRFAITALQRRLFAITEAFGADTKSSISKKQFHFPLCAKSRPKSLSPEGRASYGRFANPFRAVQVYEKLDNPERDFTISKNGCSLKGLRPKLPKGGRPSPPLRSRPDSTFGSTPDSAGRKKSQAT